MAITDVTTQRLLGGSWLVTASSDETSPTFYWYLDGLLIDVSPVGTRQFDLVPGEQVQIDVFDEATSQPGDVFPCRALISSAPEADAVKVRVEEYVDSAWVTRHTAYGSYVGYQTRVLDDGEAAQFRVVPVGEAGIDGRPRPLNVTMVRKPAEPALAYAWNAETARVTLSSS